MSEQMTLVEVRHALTCPISARWRRYRNRQPFWRVDKTAGMLGIARYGCWRCGRGAIEERAALTDRAPENTEALEQVSHLELLSKQLREQGDVQQVIFDENGVGPTLSLADELYVVAFNLRSALTPQATE